MLDFIAEHWLIIGIVWIVAVLFLARFAGFNELDKG